jgi:protein-tyrosine phosphatase
LQEIRLRRLEFEGAVNFRDLGGYAAGNGRQTRWRTLYRADSLADLTPGDLERLHALGLRTLIDFRLSEERSAKPNRLPVGHAIACIELPFVPRGTLEMLSLVRAGTIDPAEIERRVTAQYRLFCIDHTVEYRRVFEVASNPNNHPLLLHCTSGKDRTGFGIAILLRALDVPLEVVLEDYELTNHYRRAVPQLLGPGTPEAVVHILLSAQPKYLEAAFDEMQCVYGSFDAYLANGLGIGDATRARLIDALTEPFPSGARINQADEASVFTSSLARDNAGTSSTSDRDASG